MPDRERCLGEGAGGVTSEACTTRREVALKRGLQVVSVSSGVEVSATTVTSEGLRRVVG